MDFTLKQKGMENKEEIDEYNVSKMQGISLFDGYIVMFSALLLCMPGHFPSAKKNGENYKCMTGVQRA